MKKDTNVIYPGQIIRLRLKLLGVSISEAARTLGVSRSHFSEVINGHTSISANMALRLSLGIGGTPEEWLSHQTDYELDLARCQLVGLSNAVRKITGVRDAE